MVNLPVGRSSAWPGAALVAPTGHPRARGDPPIDGGAAAAGGSAWKRRQLRWRNQPSLSITNWLMVWLPSILMFPMNIGNLIIPIDELIFFRGVALAHQPAIHH